MRKGVYGNSLFFPLNFAMSLKLFKKNVCLIEEEQILSVGIQLLFCDYNEGPMQEPYEGKQVYFGSWFWKVQPNLVNLHQFSILQWRALRSHSTPSIPSTLSNPVLPLVPDSPISFTVTGLSFHLFSTTR